MCGDYGPRGILSGSRKDAGKAQNDNTKRIQKLLVSDVCSTTCYGVEHKLYLKSDRQPSSARAFWM
jgi:hypothetical protein